MMTQDPLTLLRFAVVSYEVLVSFTDPEDLNLALCETWGYDEVLLLLYKGVCVVVVLLRSGSKGFVRSLEVDEIRALLASVLRSSPGGGGRDCSVFAEIVGESICVEKLLGTTLSDKEFAKGDHNDKSIIL
ncbi:hypothetical protein ACHWQZ_G003806 [Mnemiopsis leidyi]